MRNHLLRLGLLALVLLLGTANAGRFNPAPTPPTPQPTPTPSGVLTPEDDWVGAIRSGGTVRLGPGEFYTQEYIELFRDTSIVGAGPEDTIILLDSNGGDFGEQFVMLDNDGPNRVKYRMEGLEISYLGEAPSDLLVIWGTSDLTLDNVIVSYAWDDLEAYYDEEDGSWWGVGLVVGEAASAFVTNSQFLANGTHGIAVLGGERLTVSDSVFYMNWWSGIYVRDTPVTVTGSEFVSNEVGIEIYGTAPRTLSNNHFEEQEYMDIIEEE